MMERVTTPPKSFEAAVGTSQQYRNVSAAFAVLGMSTNDSVFATQTQQRYQQRILRTAKLIEAHAQQACDACIPEPGGMTRRTSPHLYHVKLVSEQRDFLCDDENNNNSNNLHHHDQVYKVDITGTYTDIVAARKAAFALLDGPQREALASYESKRDSAADPESWPYDADTYVRATTRSKGRLTVLIETEPNSAEFVGSRQGEVLGVLFHVLQRTVCRADDRDGPVRNTCTLTGTYRTRASAREAAERVLCDVDDPSQDLAEYRLLDEDEQYLPWGAGVVGRAVRWNGDVDFVSIVRANREERVF